MKHDHPLVDLIKERNEAVDSGKSKEDIVKIQSKISSLTDDIMDEHRPQSEKTVKFKLINGGLNDN